MAITKTHPIKSTLKDAIDYICNPAKTDGKLLVSSFGCAAETADIEFAWTRQHAIDKGSNLGRHLIQAFEPGEVSPEEAHEIGMQLAAEILGGKYEFVLTTHIDKDHVHNHLIFNAVNFADYRHYHSNKRSYHNIRRVSDRLCQEHGLSVINPSQDRGKSYVEQQAERAGNSYKAKLRVAVDRLIPVSADLEDLLQRLQAEGYEIKRGKFISCRAEGQERFTRLKTLGVDYAEDAITSRIAGGPRPSRQPKQKQQISLIIDLQNNLKAKESAGFAHWIKINNLKQAAKTLNYLTEHQIDSYEDLQFRLSQLKQKEESALTSIKESERRIMELTLQIKHAEIYRQTKPVYEKYRQSNDREKFFRGHEREIILFETAHRELQKLHIRPIPSAVQMQDELKRLREEKRTQYTAYQEAKAEYRKMNTMLQNVDAILKEPETPAPENTQERT